MYGSYPYALAQSLIELPYSVVQGVLYSLITYFMFYFFIDAGQSLVRSYIMAGCCITRNIFVRIGSGCCICAGQACTVVSPRQYTSWAGRNPGRAGQCCILPATSLLQKVTPMSIDFWRRTHQLLLCVAFYLQFAGRSPAQQYFEKQNTCQQVSILPT